MELEVPIEFFLQGTPVSLQASGKSKRNWKNRIESSALRVLPDEQYFVLNQPLKIKIIVFLDAPMQGDLDNIIKPILDALNGVVYTDDRLVTDLIVKKYDPDRLVDFIDPSDTLISAQQENAPCVYVRIDTL